MHQNVCRLAAVIAAFSVSSVAFGAATQSITLRRQSVTRTAWDGLDYANDDRWVGQTSRWEPPPAVVPKYGMGISNGSLDLGVLPGNGKGVLVDYSAPQPPPRFVTHVLSSTSTGRASTYAKAGKRLDVKTASTSDQWGRGGEERDMLHYAQVLDARGTVLSKATSINDAACFAADTFFLLHGAFLAGTNVVTGVKPRAHAVTAFSKTAFFRVDEAIEYDLSVGMALKGNVDLAFSLMRWRDRATILRFDDETFGVGQGQSLDRVYKGVIQPGIYRVAVSASTRSKLNAQGKVAYDGGEAEFDVNLDFHTKPGTWGDSGGIPVFPVVASAPPVPEPSMAGLLAVGTLALVGRRRRSSE